MTHSELTTGADRLVEELDSQIVAMENLRSCLEEENRALQSRDPELLLAVTERKTACLGEADRIARLHRSAEPADTSTRNSRNVARRREQLDTLTRTCRDLNNANGALIRRQRVRVETTLRILRGDPGRTDVYGATGQQSQDTPTRRILASI